MLRSGIRRGGGGFVEMVCLSNGWSVFAGSVTTDYPPLQDSRFIEIVGGGGAGLLRWFVCPMVGR